MPVGFSRARSQPTCRCCCRPSSNLVLNLKTSCALTEFRSPTSEYGLLRNRGAPEMPDNARHAGAHPECAQAVLQSERPPASCKETSTVRPSN